MRSLMLVDGTDLTTWANRRDSQAVLPKLLRCLIHATAKNVVRIGFPAGEGVSLGGWDGVVSVEEGDAFVPNGTSVWELGTNKDIKGKADDDYTKRTKDPLGIDPAQSTFVFVTPRRWGKKDDWVSARQSEGIWREVRAYDADDLETWLENAPAVHVWLSILIGKHPENVIDLGNFWADWSEVTRPPIKPEFLLAGRTEAVEKLKGWLNDSSMSFSLQAESRDEALAVFAAVIQLLPLEERITHLSKAVVVHDITAWHRLTASDEPLILIPSFEVRDAVSRAFRNGHRVITPLGRSDSTGANTLVLPRISREEAAKILMENGFVEDRARDLALLARRSMMSFRRKLALSPEVQQPRWACPAEARTLLPVMLAGSWNDSKEGDRQAVSSIADTPYQEVHEVLLRWANEIDPPVRRIGDSWFVVSNEDSWMLLARYLTREDLERFERIALEVLGTPDPRFDLPEDQRWMARVLGASPEYSDLLKKGLADTLAIMGSRGGTLTLSFGVSAGDYAKRVVRKLLNKANEDWRVWASLSSLLPLLAESAPDEFLAAVEKGLSGEQPTMIKLFTDQKNTLFDSSPHTGLLWALETLAWSTEYLGSAALILSKLTKLDPGGKLANRPKRSLREIFLLWHPQTTATLEQRLRVLDTVREREPDVSWSILNELIPEINEVATNTHKPKWREWVPDTPKGITHSEVVRGIDEIASRMLEDVGEIGSRWQDLIEALPMLTSTSFKAVVNKLESLEPGNIDATVRSNIWNSLRSLISKHRTFSDAAWALSQEQVNELSEILTKFEPDEPIARYGWLFTSWPELPEGHPDNWEEIKISVSKARLAAINAVYTKDGIQGLLALVDNVEQPIELGATLGESDLHQEQEDILLCEQLSSDNLQRAMFSRGFVIGRLRKLGRDWGEAKLTHFADKWTPRQCAEFLLCLPDDRRTWNKVESLGTEIEKIFWSHFRQYVLNNSEDVEYVVRKLIEHDRPHVAIDLLAYHKRDEHVSLKLISDVLESVLHTSIRDEDPPSSSFGYHITELLKLLQESNDIEENRIVTLEWAFISLHHKYGWTPKYLNRELARNPQFFAEVVAIVYRAEGEEVHEISEEDKLRAQHAYDLLDSWRTVPGFIESNNINVEELKTWVRSAREALTEMGRGAIGDQLIGKVLSHSPVGLDGSWPHEAVREVIEDTASENLEIGFELG